MLDVYAAPRNLDALTGQTAPDDILSQIFSTLCIGSKSASEQSQKSRRCLSNQASFMVAWEMWGSPRFNRKCSRWC